MEVYCKNGSDSCGKPNDPHYHCSEPHYHLPQESLQGSESHCIELNFLETLLMYVYLNSIFSCIHQFSYPRYFGLFAIHILSVLKRYF